MSHIKAEFEVSTSALPDVRIERRRGYSDAVDGPESLQLPSGACKEVENATAAVVNFLCKTRDVQVVAATLEFVYDASRTLWLTHVGHVELQHHDEKAAALLRKKSSLPNLPAAAGTVDNAAPRCRGEFCQTPLASLPGLFRLVEMLRKQEASDNEDDLVEDKGQRFQIGNNNLLLAHAELDLHRRRPSSQDEASALALQWQEADNVLRRELGRANPTQFYRQVLVCANCHRVYTTINKVRDSDFQKLEEKPTRTSGDVASAASSEPYDRMFLEELAKQSAELEPSNGPEQDAVIRPPSGSTSGRERAVLPSLQASPSDPTHKKRSVHGSLASESRSNQHASEEGQKVARLEAELSHATSKLAGVEARRRKLEHELVQTRAQCTAMLRDKDDHARKQLLEMEFRLHSKQSDATPKSGASSSSGELARLIETIESLNRQLDQANRADEQAKQQLVQAQQRELKKLHETYQLELETLRLSEHAAREQADRLQLQMQSLESQAQVATTQARSAKAALADLTTSRLVALEETNQRLERQLAAVKLQQGELKTVAAATVAKQGAEAMDKQLQSKLEYLKAQLASEIKCREELGSHLAQVTSAMEQMKVDKRQALAEQEHVFRSHSERLESAFAIEKDSLATQQAALQARVAALQANVTDLVQELSLCKSREANAKLAMDKTVDENVRLTRQLVDAEAQVEALQDAAKVGTSSVLNASDETKRVQMEALLRRLDNERQYLKSQCQGQQEMKEKSQQQVSALQYELRELQDAMEEALREREHKMTAVTAEKRSQEQELRGTIECLEAGKLLLTRQLKDVQAKFADAREQALLARDELDKARIEANELRAQLLAAKEECGKQQTYAKTASERMRDSLVAVKSSLKAMEDEKNRHIERLEEENTRFMGKVAATQGDMVVLEGKLDGEKRRAKKETATAMLAMVLGEKAARWRLRVQYRAFSHAKLHARVRRAQSDAEQRRAEERERLREDYMVKCDEMTQTLHDERLEAIRTVNEAHERERLELQAFYQQEKAQLQEELTATTAAQLQHAKDELEARSNALASESQRALHELETDKSKLRQSNTQLSEALAERTQKCQVMAATFEDELAALKAEWEAKQASWTAENEALRAELEARRAQFTEQLSLETSKLVLEHVQELAALEALDEANAWQRQVQFTAQSAMLSEELGQRYAAFHTRSLAALTRQHQAEREEEVRAETQRWQKELDLLRQAQEKALEDALGEAERKAATQLAALQKDMKERKGAAVVQCTSKWQRAMEELQERHEVDRKRAYREGLEDREKEWQQAAVQIKARQRDELEQVQQEALAAIRAAEERLELRFQAQLADWKTRVEEQHAQKIQTLADEIETRERERAQEHFDASADVLEQELAAKWTVAIEEQRTQLERKLADEKARLVAALTEEKEQALRALREAHEASCRQLDKSWAAKLEEIAQSSARAHEKELDSLRDELEREKNVVVKQLEESFAKRLEEQLSDQEGRLLREQEDAIAQVQEDAEKLIQQVERAMRELKQQKEQLETELLSLRSALEEAEDAHFDAHESFKKRQKQAAFHFLHLLMRATRKSNEEAQASVASRTEMETKLHRLEAELDDEKARWGNLMARIQETWTQVQVQHGEMTQTLTHYKRDELVAHRSASAVLSNEISIVTKQLEEVDEMKTSLDRDVESLQTEAKTSENSLRELMLQSSDSSGSLNMAVVAKKRRLNEEFEALLERIEKKKAEIRTVDQTLAALRARREEKEQEMRQMERKLVEILVQQQKQMLRLVSAVREVSLPTAAG